MIFLCLSRTYHLLYTTFKTNVFSLPHKAFSNDKLFSTYYGTKIAIHVGFSFRNDRMTNN